MQRLNRRHADLKRLSHVVQVLIKHGFGYFVQQMFKEDHFFTKNLKKWKIFKRVFKPPETTVSIGEQLRTVMEELGPTYIKLGQVLSTRPDLIPIEICEELGKLQDSAPSVPYEKIYASFIDQFGKTPDELFLSFDRNPIGAASIAQVHTAQLDNGTEVIVKVLRPNIEKTIASDLNLLRQLADLIHRHITTARIYDFPGVVDQFSRTIRFELDLNVEARNIAKFRKNFKKKKHVYIPKVFHEFSSRKIMTLERLHGQRLNKFIVHEQSKERRHAIAYRGSQAVLSMIFIDGLFHADPHPGNVFVLDHEKVGFIDFGMIGRLNTDYKRHVSDLLIGVVEHDIDRLIETFRRLNMIGDTINSDKFKTDLEEFIDQYYEIPLKQVRIDQVLISALTMIRTYDVRVPRELYLMIKTLILSEGIAHQLDPDFDMIRYSKPFVQRMIRQRYNPYRLLKQSKKLTAETLDLLATMPKELKQIISMIRRGELKVEFEHYGLENLIAELDRSSNRIALSLVLAALIVGSSLIMLTRTGPLYMDVPVFGLIGYLIAGLMGLWLAWAILRSGKF